MMICFLKKNIPLHKGRRILAVALARIGMTSQWIWQRRREREATLMEKKMIVC